MKKSYTFNNFWCRKYNYILCYFINIYFNQLAYRHDILNFNLYDDTYQSMYNIHKQRPLGPSTISNRVQGSETRMRTGGLG
jgi:hypothetical protein